MFCSRCGTQVETSVRFCPNCGEDLSKITGAGQGKTAQMAAPPEDETALIRDGLKEEYDLEKELGRGGMAVVYKARDKQLEREVAIKVLPFSLSFDAEFVERFQREARTAGKLEHPNIIPIYRVGRSGRVIYFVMKFIRGKSLSQVIEARGAMPVPEIKRMLKEATSALGYAHKHGIVHRDIKPDNIMFDELGQAIVTDFGIAKAQSGARLTGTGMSIGTPHYMSPEQARAQNLDGRSDIYSLGVVAYQCLTGHVPFDGEDSFSIGYKHIMEELPVPALDTAEQREMFAVVQKMMAKKPEDRYQNADELVLALEGAAAAQADLSTMRTLAIEPKKLGIQPPPFMAPKPTGKPAAPPIASAATTPLPRASASMGKPKETESEAAAPPPPPPPPKPAMKRPMGGERKSGGSKLPVALAAGLGIAALGLGGYYFGVMKPQQARAAAQRAQQDSSARRQQLATAAADSIRRDSIARANAAAEAQRRTDSIATARQLARRDPPPTRRDTPRTRPTTTTAAADTGTLSIAWRGTPPANPRITVDGQAVTRTRTKLPVGTHQLRIEADGFRPYTSTVTIQANRTNSLPVRMEAAGGAVAGRDTGRTTPTTVAANCTSPTVSISNPRSACWDTRPRPRVTPQISAPSSCTAPVRTANILVQVSAAGEVQGNPTVQRASNCPAFNDAARAFALDMTFLPAQKGGQPVVAWVVVPISASRN